MAIMRISRNLEASLIDHLVDELQEDWSNVRVTSSFAEVYDGKLPCIQVQMFRNPLVRKEIGSNRLLNEFIIDIRIFAVSEEQRQDLSDWVIEKIMRGFDYVEHTLTNGQVTASEVNGRVTIILKDNRIEFENKESLIQEDRNRQLIRCLALVNKCH